jgi:hypothetical protein
MKTLDHRFQELVAQLAEKYSICYNKELTEQVTQDLCLGYRKNSTWEDIAKIVESRMLKEKIEQNQLVHFHLIGYTN